MAIDLTQNLIAFWPGDEASGNLLDAHTNGLDLTDTGTVTSNPGKVYSLARQYTAANNEYHVRPGDDALLSMGDVDMTVAAWMYADSKTDWMTGPCKYLGGGAADREYSLGYAYNPTDRFYLLVRDIADVANGLVYGNNLGSPSTGTWYLVVAWHDAVNDVLGIQVNNGTPDTLAAWTGGIRDADNAFSIGAQLTPASPWDGRVGPSMLWKSAPGGGGVLTAEERTYLWNSGDGRTYEGLTETADGYEIALGVRGLGVGAGGAAAAAAQVATVTAAYLSSTLDPGLEVIPRMWALIFLAHPNIFLLWDEAYEFDTDPPDVHPDYVPTQVEYDVLYDWLNDHNMLPAEINAAIGTQVSGRTWREIAVELFAWLWANP